MRSVTAQPVRQAVTVAASVFGATPGHDTLAFNSRHASSIASRSKSMVLVCVAISPAPAGVSDWFVDLHTLTNRASSHPCNMIMYPRQ